MQPRQDESSSEEQRLQEARRFWDAAAASFDDEPDHGLGDRRVLQAWTKLLTAWIPLPQATVLDIGCGTGSLSVVLASLGHSVTGIDFAPEMIARARSKATRYDVPVAFHVMDAAFPELPAAQFDVLLCRHLLWTLPQPRQVLARWLELMKPTGRLILVEGFWETGVGLHAEELVSMLPAQVSVVAVEDLRGNPNLWGRAVTDERYALIGDLQAQG